MRKRIDSLRSSLATAATGVHHGWWRFGLIIAYAVLVALVTLESLGDPKTPGTPIAIVAYSYQPGSFHVVVDFHEHPAPEIIIRAFGAPSGLRLALGPVGDCRATEAHSAKRTETLTAYETGLNAYFPVALVPELERMHLHRIAISRHDRYPIVCELERGSARRSYDSHAIRFIRPLFVPLGSDMVLSRSDTYRLDQPDVENVRFDGAGAAKVEKRSAVAALLESAPPDAPPANTAEYAVTTVTWTDRHESKMYEFAMLFLAAASAGAVACLIEAIRPCF
jgi:hypothetical protein